MLFHKWVAKEMAKIKKGDLIEPKYEMDPKKDHFLGPMSADLKKLFTLYMRVSKEARETTKASLEAARKIVLMVSIGREEAAIEEAKKKIQALEVSVSINENRETAMKNVFWLSVRDEFPEANGKSLSVCKGFKVVWSKEEERSPIIGTIIIPVP